MPIRKKPESFGIFALERGHDLLVFPNWIFSKRARVIREECSEDFLIPSCIALRREIFPGEDE